jgi:hypothetical protein
VACAVALNLTEPPRPSEFSVAAVEGWIHLPVPAAWQRSRTRRVSFERRCHAGRTPGTDVEPSSSRCSARSA